jgi:MFS superfamily sulfate permease-like transporter
MAEETQPAVARALVALILATLATALFNLPVATLGSKFGGIPQGLPSFGGLDLDPTHLSDRWHLPLPLPCWGQLNPCVWWRTA